MTVPRSGEAEVLTVPYQRAPSPGVTQVYMGSLFTWLARAQDTGGAFSLVDVRARRGTEPPRHVHTHEDEAVVVLDGEVTWWSGDTDLHGTPGQFLFLPRGVEHGFRLQTPEAHLLILVSPAGLEATFDAFSAPAPDLTLPPPATTPPPPGFLEEVFGAFTAAGVRFTASIPPPP